MRAFLVALATVSLVVSAYSPAPAADDKKLTPQQEKMKSCNAEASDKKGDERKAFMSSCLKAGAPAAPMTQQDNVRQGAQGGGAEGRHERAPPGRQKVLANPPA